MPTLELSQGLGKFLNSKLSGLIDGINEDIAAKVISTAGIPAPVFVYRDAIPDNPDRCMVAIKVVSDSKTREGMGIITRTVTYKIACLIPWAGDNLPENFEIAYRITSDWVLTLLDDDSQMLIPVINAGVLPYLEARGADRGDAVDLWPSRLTDGKTLVHGWSVLYQVIFSVATHAGQS